MASRGFALATMATVTVAHVTRPCLASRTRAFQLGWRPTVVGRKFASVAGGVRMAGKGKAEGEEQSLEARAKLDKLRTEVEQLRAEVSQTRAAISSYSPSGPASQAARPAPSPVVAGSSSLLEGAAWQTVLNNTATYVGGLSAPEEAMLRNVWVTAVGMQQEQLSSLMAVRNETLQQVVSVLSPEDRQDLEQLLSPEPSDWELEMLDSEVSTCTQGTRTQSGEMLAADPRAMCRPRRTFL